MILLAKPLRRVLSACVTSRELFGLRSDSRGFNICSAPCLPSRRATGWRIGREMSSNPVSDQLPPRRLTPLKQPPYIVASSLHANPRFRTATILRMANIAFLESTVTFSHKDEVLGQVKDGYACRRLADTLGGGSVPHRSHTGRKRFSVTWEIGLPARFPR